MNIFKVEKEDKSEEKIKMEIQIKSEFKEEAEFENSDPFKILNLEIVKAESCQYVKLKISSRSYEDCDLDSNRPTFKEEYSVPPPSPQALDAVSMLSDSNIFVNKKQEQRDQCQLSQNSLVSAHVETQHDKNEDLEIINKKSEFLLQEITAITSLEHATDLEEKDNFEAGNCEVTANPIQTKPENEQPRISLSNTSEVPDRYICFHCCKSYKLKRSLRRHEKVHEAEAKTVCHVGTAESAAVSHLREPMVETSPLTRTISLLQCEICPKQFIEPHGLRSHIMRVHSNTIEGGRAAVFQYKCLWCSKAFFKQSELTQHKRVHTGEKSFECQRCSQKFGRKDFLRTHELRKHSRDMNGENGDSPKNHKCLYCGKEFFQKYTLQIHEKIHTGANLYGCEFCEKKFRALYDKKLHEAKAHTSGVKTFEKS